MAKNTINNYIYKDTNVLKHHPHFAVKKITVDLQCSAIEDQASKYYKIYWIEDGSGTYDIDFNTFDIEGSGVFCISPRQIFSVRNEKVKLAYEISFDKEFYCVETHGKEIACNGLIFNNVHRATAVSIPKVDVPIFSSIIKNLIKEFGHPGNAHREMLETYLRMFMIQTLRQIDEQELMRGPKTHKNNQTVIDFIALVDKQFRTVHSVSEYAAQLFISPKSLTKKLNSLGYPTPTKVIRERLMIEAKRALKYTTENVKEIAYDLGFEDPAYFSRLFTREEEMTPLEYRKGK
ncbi:MAG: AraC family transcriptional activator of pobA [Saprospiraceae bacterium]|jgi:AraC family transcriptional activator of pobA|tara:strand:- start:3647 stop:4519 length:873 start_codon:yes stop_codon:yes gene_type:complete